jgi:hypothetical protein
MPLVGLSGISLAAYSHILLDYAREIPGRFKEQNTKLPANSKKRISEKRF